ncbi:exodeoxyribonuclease VII large subunit [Gilvimarinus xylanilyticus]|uniref:Exodeoxyribonuclease 7 large subunit n=1 Tax=Gilvimarinus xylanilyticus TaxID=2944139 RepID=A0A9X2I1P4_9GAMM|nr:exodeoxyribonuclease VII large subunit [Gilvimarinus xylanilyticus]MCP8898715.1 exodeoxyribonuclease VII large subunit [Gilvimarinus xylanilyticus]
MNPLNPTEIPAEREILSVSRLNWISRQLLETHLPLIWVEGEISNLAKPSSGHWYFTLKDDKAQVRCAMFRGRNQQVRFPVQNGQQVLLRARVSIYEGRGDYQLIAEHLEEAGLGALQRAFETLKNQLASEGLFAPERKQPLPAAPQHIGVITSPSGAAVRDVLSVIKRRYPTQKVTVIPVPVQGVQAAPEIIRALDLAVRAGGIDLLIITRGGGSIEDLWAFNDEALARKVAACPIATISAVGHETDFTIADFVADVRAPTPSAAAEIAVPDIREHLSALKQRELALGKAIAGQLKQQHTRLEALQKRLRHPGEALRHQAQRLDQLEIRLTRSAQQRLNQASQTLDTLKRRQQAQHPQARLTQASKQLQSLSHHLQHSMNTRLKNYRQQLHEKARVLDSVSPLATLDRGFAVVRDDRGQVVRQSGELSPGQKLTTKLGRGEFQSEVIATSE